MSLSTLLFQATIDEGCIGEAGSVIRAALDVVDPWIAYKIARQAMRYGHHSIAADIFTKLTAEVGQSTAVDTVTVKTCQSNNADILTQCDGAVTFNAADKS